MNSLRYHDKITCAYLYPITKYGYPPDIRQTLAHIDEMAALGFRSLELEGIGEENIQYLYTHHEAIGERLQQLDCKVPVLCIVLPQLSAIDTARQSKALEWFEMGCTVAKKMGVPAVLDNGPLLPLEYAADAPIRRHYSGDGPGSAGLPPGFDWDRYWNDLVSTYQSACRIASAFHLDYHMHPCEGSLITDTDSFINFANAVDHPNLLFNLDTANQFYFKDNLPLSVLRLAHKINYIHISDNRGHKVEHLVPGDGQIHWDSFFSALQEKKFNGRFAIDVGGAETGIDNISDAYQRCATWLEQQIETYLLNV